MLSCEGDSRFVSIAMTRAQREHTKTLGDLARNLTPSKVLKNTGATAAGLLLVVLIHNASHDDGLPSPAQLATLTFGMVSLSGVIWSDIYSVQRLFKTFNGD